VLRRSLLVGGLVALAAVLATPAALGVRVQVRVEGRTQTIYGAAQPTLDFNPNKAPPGPPNALDALEAASEAGEFYYHVRTTSFGPFVDQIGRFPASGTAGWVFKVNWVSPPVGADQVQVRDGDVVLWYWAQFGIVPGGPPTLRLQRRPRSCYTVTALDDAGRPTSVAGAALNVDGRRVRTRSGRACIGPHRGLVRATLDGAIRSNAVR
jgi:Domain of unknown function (DUF4430)